MSQRAKMSSNRPLLCLLTSQPKLNLPRVPGAAQPVLSKHLPKVSRALSFPAGVDLLWLSGLTSSHCIVQMHRWHKHNYINCSYFSNYFSIIILSQDKALATLLPTLLVTNPTKMPRIGPVRRLSWVCYQA